MNFEVPAIRPPSEAGSLLIRVTRNCPWNKCSFCYGTLYNREKFELRLVDDIKQDILSFKDLTDKVIQWANNNDYGNCLEQVASANGIYWIHNDGVKTAFLGDSNTLIIKTDDLIDILKFLYQTFPTLERVTSYGRAKTALHKSLDDLKRLYKAGLTRLHIGLETGSNIILTDIDKGATAEEMILAGKKIIESGISLSEYVILGLGGKDKWQEHAIETARVLNIINPDYIRLRTLILKPGTPLYNKQISGQFKLLTPEEVLKEEKVLIENLNVTSMVVSDHISNYLQIDGKMPDDKPAMLDKIQNMLEMPQEQRDKLLQSESLRSI
ncbi:MAG: radical SAM protein [Chloroflexi bacterium]|nr:radical SAM protein [Chloroflexota bacterium]